MGKYLILLLLIVEMSCSPNAKKHQESKVDSEVISQQAPETKLDSLSAETLRLKEKVNRFKSQVDSLMKLSKPN